MKKEIILNLLKVYPDYISGTRLAETLHVSRNAICKTIRQLGMEGFDIQSIPHKGYQLIKVPNGLSKTYVECLLSDSRYTLDYFKSIPSTNSYLKNKALNDVIPWATVFSSEQTAGRGRVGRTFFSPLNSGIYCSILLDSGSIIDPLQITTMTAVAITDAIEIVCNKKTSIKWVNDIYNEGKKICGILTEASINCENGLMDYVVVGFGINVFEPINGYPLVIKEVAGSIYNKDDIIETGILSKLLAKILERFAFYFDHLNEKLHLKKYQQSSCLINTCVEVHEGNSIYEALVKSINDNCELVVDVHGKEKILKSGEVSLKLTRN